MSDTSFLCNGFDVWEWCSYSKFAFCEGVFDALFLERFQTAMKNRGVKQAQLESDRMLAELGRNWGSRLY